MDGNGDGTGAGDLWVFGYGSLLWNTGFEHEERRLARLPGFRRAFCLRSIRYRGTPEAPGLVLALDPDAEASCQGVAFRVAAARAAQVRAYLHGREMGTSSYHETHLPLLVEGVGEVRALAYVMDTAHFQYARLSIEEQAEVIARAAGPAGPNRDYLHNTVAHLVELGIRDDDLERLDRLVRAHQGERTSDAGETSA